MMKFVAHEINGCWAGDIDVWVDHRLETMPYAQAGVILRNGKVILMSYSTEAATLDTIEGWLTIDCLCSATTRRHVSAFLREYCPAVSYYDAKAAFAGGYAINVYTGEQMDRATGEILNADQLTA